MQTVYKKETVSIVIAAYNNPAYTRKTLKSIVEQQYRPLEIIISDDNSPTSLEPLATEFDVFQNNQFKIRYFRQPSNLGVCDNFTFVVNQATGKYLIPMPHDNWFTDTNFISDAVEIMEKNPACHLCVANSVYENTNKEMLKLPESLNAKDSWVVLEGDAFIRLWLKGGMGWTQAYMLDNDVVRALGAFEEPYCVSESLAKQLNIAADIGFGFIYVLSGVGSVALSGKTVCKIGTPENSYSRSDAKWRKTRSKVKFVNIYNIYQANLEGQHAQAVKKAAKKQALNYIDHILDFRIMRYYNYSMGIIFLMCFALLRRPWFLLRPLLKSAAYRIMGSPPKSKLRKY